MQWYEYELFDSPVAGYLVADHRAKHLVLMFRGAHSVSDVVHSLRFGQTEYVPWNVDKEGWQNKTHPFACMGDVIDRTTGRPATVECKVHRGVLQMYHRTMDMMDELTTITVQDPAYRDYRFIIAGHSMGGVIATIVGADYKMRGFDPTVVSFGAPKFGNHGFATWYDRLFETEGNDEHLLKDGLKRRYFRVTKDQDLYVRMPLRSEYHHTSGEVFIADADTDQPDPTNTFFCAGQTNTLCSHAINFTPINLLFFEPNHMHYFTDLHGCAIEHSFVPIRDVPPPGNPDKNPY